MVLVDLALMFVPLSYGNRADGLSSPGKHKDDDCVIQIAQRDPTRFAVVFPFIQADEQWSLEHLFGIGKSNSMLFDVEPIFTLIPFEPHGSVYTHVVYTSKLSERMK